MASILKVGIDTFIECKDTFPLGQMGCKKNHMTAKVSSSKQIYYGDLSIQEKSLGFIKKTKLLIM